ncbi:MAG: hypothetical protein AB7R00_08170 [Kofleriaceae bacterium]
MPLIIGCVDGGDDELGDTSEEIGGGVRLVDPKDAYYGLTLGEWSAWYWTWQYEIPWAQHPVNGADCSAGNSGPVWFLSAFSVSEDLTVRTCTIPSDTAIFFVNGGGECSTIPGASMVGMTDFGTSYNGLRQCAIEWEIISPTLVLDIEVDGHPIHNPDRFLVESPEFAFELPEDSFQEAAFGLEDVAAGLYRSVQYGRGFMIKPLSSGSHTIDMHVEYGDGTKRTIQYQLTVAQ